MSSSNGRDEVPVTGGLPPPPSWTSEVGHAGEEKAPVEHDSGAESEDDDLAGFDLSDPMPGRAPP